MILIRFYQILIVFKDVLELCKTWVKIWQQDNKNKATKNHQKRKNLWNRSMNTMVGFVINILHNLWAKTLDIEF